MKEYHIGIERATLIRAIIRDDTEGWRDNTIPRWKGGKTTLVRVLRKGPEVVTGKECRNRDERGACRGHVVPETSRQVARLVKDHLQRSGQNVRVRKTEVHVHRGWAYYGEVSDVVRDIRDSLHARYENADWARS